MSLIDRLQNEDSILRVLVLTALGIVLQVLLALPAIYGEAQTFYNEFYVTHQLGAFFVGLSFDPILFGSTMLFPVIYSIVDSLFFVPVKRIVSPFNIQVATVAIATILLVDNVSIPVFALTSQNATAYVTTVTVSFILSVLLLGLIGALETIFVRSIVGSNLDGLDIACYSVKVGSGEITSVLDDHLRDRLGIKETATMGAVSYTHLTLPTICSV